MSQEKPTLVIGPYVQACHLMRDHRGRWTHVSRAEQLLGFRAGGATVLATRHADIDLVALARDRGLEPRFR